MRDIPLLLTWAALVPISLWSAHLGVILWIWCSLIAPNELVFGFMSAVPYAKLTAALTFLALIINREWRFFYFDGTMAIFVGLALLAIIANAIALSPGHEHLLDRYLKVLTLGVVVAGVMASRWRMHAVIVVICIAFGFNMVTDGLKFLVSGGAHKVTGRSSVGDNNQLAVAFLITLPLIYYLCRHSAWRLMRIGFGLLLAAGLVAVIGTFSRGGFVGLIVFALWMTAKSSRKVLSLTMLAVVAGGLYAIVPSSYFDRVDTINTAEHDSSFMARVVAWKISMLIALDRPFTGGGFYAVQLPDVWNHYISQLGKLDFVTTPEPPEAPLAAHSIYFEMLGDFGFTGLGLFLLLLGRSYLLLARVRRRAQEDPAKAWANDLAGMLQVSLIVFCTAGAALSMAKFEALYVVFALVSRLNRHICVEAVRPAEAAAVVPGPGAPTASQALRPAMGGEGWRNRTVRTVRT